MSGWRWVKGVGRRGWIAPVALVSVTSVGLAWTEAPDAMSWVSSSRDHSAGGIESRPGRVNVAGQFALTSTTATVARGDTARYELAVLDRHRRRGLPRVTARGLPAGARLLAPAGRDHGQRVLPFTITTRADTPVGDHVVRLVVRDGGRAERLTLHLVVVSGRRSLAIHGDLTSLLVPGRRLPLDLRVDNPNGIEIQVTHLAVTIAAIDRAHRGCTVELNYGVDQFSGRYERLRVPARASRRLSQLFPAAQWPQIEMVETGTNQDVCKGARLTLRYEASARSGESARDDGHRRPDGAVRGGRR